MKNRDTYELFEIFKPGVRDDLSFPRKLGYWFKNVYWYHFKVITLVALFAIILLIIFIGDMMNKPNDDLGVILCGEAFLSFEQEEQVANKIKEVIEDVNGDGEITIAFQSLTSASADTEASEASKDAAAPYDQFIVANEQKLTLSFADDQFILYILDQIHMDPFVADGAMEPMETFGIESENPYCIPLADSTWFQELGIQSMPENGWYAGIKMINDSRGKDEKIQAKYENAARVLRILAGQE